MAGEPTIPKLPPASSANRATEMGGRFAASAGRIALTTLALIGLWALLAAVTTSDVIPTPWAVFEVIGDNGYEFWSTNIWATLSPALLGYLIGNVLGFALAVAIVLAPLIERPMLRLSIAVYCLPIVAIGPILVILMEGDGPGVVLATLSCFFPTLIGTVLGLLSADRTQLDLVAAYGGGRLEQLRRVMLPAALPSLLAALRLAAPLAVLGAMVAEYMGADEGLGVAMLAAQRTFQAEQVWAIALVAACVAGTGYAIVSLIARFAIRWPAPTVAIAAGTQSVLRQSVPRSPLRRVAVWILGLTASIAAILLVWVLALKVANVDSFIAKGPGDVWEAVVTGPDGGENRSDLLDALLITLGHAALGFFAGLLMGVGVAAAFMLSKVLERTMMPVAIALQSFPVIAMVPLIALVLGRNSGSVALVCGLVTFFATLVYVSVGMRGTPPAVLDLIRAYGGSRFTALRRAMLPAALPAVFASARLAAPGALFGALLAEWLVTGDGLGYLMLQSGAAGEYVLVWAATVVVTVVSILLYGLIAAAERRVSDLISGTGKPIFAT